jgi:2,4-dienoyl-CoA reductase (NADPH2)
VTLFDKSTEIGGQFNMAKRIPGKEEFHETIRYFKWLTNDLQQKGKLDLKLGCEISTTDMENNKSIDKWIIATGVNPRIPRIPGIEHPNVLSYIDVLRNNATVGKKVAIIGAGGIGFDVAEFLLHQGDKTADEVSVPEFLSDWGIDIENKSRGGLLERTLSSTTPPKRQLYLMQRKKGKLGAGLGKTTGWIHRSTLTKSKAVTMLDSVSYDKIDENGFLHITMSKGKSKESMILDVDNIIICAGQTPKNDLEEKVGGDLKKSVFTIGGAYEALELDAKRAIDMGTRLALKIHDPSIVPGKHKLESGKGPEEKLYNIMKKYLS